MCFLFVPYIVFILYLIKIYIFLFAIWKAMEISFFCFYLEKIPIDCQYECFSDRMWLKNYIIYIKQRHFFLIFIVSMIFFSSNFQMDLEAASWGRLLCIFVSSFFFRLKIYKHYCFSSFVYIYNIYIVPSLNKIPMIFFYFSALSLELYLLYTYHTY